MSKYKELLERIEDADLKAALNAEISQMSQEKGEYGRKLMEKDAEMKKLNDKLGESASYADAFRVLKNKGVDVKDIPAMLEKLNVQKTLEDDLMIASESLKAKDTELNELRKFRKTVEVRNAVGKYVAEEKANFKDESGQPIKILDRFISEEKLFADIDVSNEVLIRERVKSVLKDGLQAQEAVRKEFGFQGSPTHPVPEGQGGPGQNTNLAAQIREIAQKQGVAAGFDALLRLEKGE
jgi:hypothetical protein